MGIQRSQEDSWTKEMAKWEMRPVLVGGTYIEPIPVAMGGRGGAPFQEYPKSLYKAESADGGPRICAMHVVHDADQQIVAEGQGWSDGQERAIARVGENQREMARLAANRAHNDRWMSDAAKAEAQSVDETTMQHLPVIPETPIKKRGRPVKVKETAHV